MPSIPIHCKCMGGWFVLKSIAHGSKCPIELCLRTDVGRKFSWLMKTCSEFPLHLPDAAYKVIQIVHVHMQTSGVRFVKTVNINFIDNLPTFPITKSLLSYLKLLLICLLELGFGFDQSLLRGKPVGKSPYYRSFNHSANWRVKDFIGEVTYHLPQNAELTCMLDPLLNTGVVWLVSHLLLSGVFTDPCKRKWCRQCSRNSSDISDGQAQMSDERFH